MNAEISHTLDVVRRGGVIVYPTDTVWGIGCDATSVEAVARIYALKRRDDAKALLTLVDSVEQLDRWFCGVPEIAYELIAAAVSPLTIVVDGSMGLAHNLVAPDGSIGVRVTTDPFCRELCRRLGRPLVSTSANVSGSPGGVVYGEIDSEIINGVDYVADWRRDDSSRSKPSTVIRLHSDSSFKILRP